MSTKRSKAESPHISTVIEMNPWYSLSPTSIRPIPKPFAAFMLGCGSQDPGSDFLQEGAIALSEYISSKLLTHLFSRMETLNRAYDEEARERKNTFGYVPRSCPDLVTLTAIQVILHKCIATRARLAPHFALGAAIGLLSAHPHKAVRIETTLDVLDKIFQPCTKSPSRYTTAIAKQMTSVVTNYFSQAVDDLNAIITQNSRLMQVDKRITQLRNQICQCLRTNGAPVLAKTAHTRSMDERSVERNVWLYREVFEKNQSLTKVFESFRKIYEKKHWSELGSPNAVKGAIRSHAKEMGLDDPFADYRPAKGRRGKKNLEEKKR